MFWLVSHESLVNVHNVAMYPVLLYGVSWLEKHCQTAAALAHLQRACNKERGNLSERLCDMSLALK